MVIPNPLVIVVMYLDRLRKFWFQDRYAFVWLLLSVPVMISFHSIVHEGTHSLVSGDFPKIIPFLMEYKGTFHNGVTVPDPGKQLDGWSGSPQIGALLITVGLALLFLLINFRSPIVGLLLRAWFVAAAADFIANTFLVLSGTCIAGKDWADASFLGDCGSTAWWIFTAFLWLILLSHFVWLCWSKWWDDPLPDRGFWGYRWAAFVLGILATISLIFYMLVRDDGIGYGSGSYIFGLVLQFAAFWFYWIYYGLSLKHPQE